MNMRRLWLNIIDEATVHFNRLVLFRWTAQQGHFIVMRWLRRLDDSTMFVRVVSLLHLVSYRKSTVNVGGLELSQRLILAAGLLKGDGFASEREALNTIENSQDNIIPGWRVIPALMGPVEYGSFTREPRPGNSGTVFWRYEEKRSTQNYVGLRNPGACAAARFLGNRRDKLPGKYGINVAVSPEVNEIDLQVKEVCESVEYFLDAGVTPSWFTLNLSCPNTEDDPQGYQLEANAKQLCGGFLQTLRDRQLAIPLWVKISPRLKNDQYCKLLRIFNDVGVKAVVATNTLAQPIPDSGSHQASDVRAGVGGSELFPDSCDAVSQLLAEKNRRQYSVDVIACGGILDGASLRAYQRLGVNAGQYWSALVFRGPFAAAIIESELEQNDYDYEAVHRESLA